MWLEPLETRNHNTEQQTLNCKYSFQDTKGLFIHEKARKNNADVTEAPTGSKFRSTK